MASYSLDGIERQRLIGEHVINMSSVIAEKRIKIHVFGMKNNKRVLLIQCCQICLFKKYLPSPKIVNLANIAIFRNFPFLKRAIFDDHLKISIVGNTEAYPVHSTKETSSGFRTFSE